MVSQLSFFFPSDIRGFIMVYLYIRVVMPSRSYNDIFVCVHVHDRAYAENTVHPSCRGSDGIIKYQWVIRVNVQYHGWSGDSASNHNPINFPVETKNERLWGMHHGARFKTKL